MRKNWGVSLVDMSVKRKREVYTCSKCGITHHRPGDRDNCKHWGEYGNGESLQEALDRGIH